MSPPKIANNTQLVSHLKKEHIGKLTKDHMIENVVNMDRSDTNDKLWYSLYGEEEDSNSSHVVFYDGYRLRTTDRWLHDSPIYRSPFSV